jgi:hypothetical protein
MKITKTRNRKIINLRKSKKQMKQTGGFTFLSGIYAFFCPMEVGLNYVKNGEAPRSSELDKILSFRAWSYKIFAPSTFGRKIQGDKLNLVVDTSLGHEITRFFDKIANVDEHFKQQKDNSFQEFTWNISKFLGKLPFNSIKAALRISEFSTRVILFTVINIINFVAQYKALKQIDVFNSIVPGKSEEEKEHQIQQRHLRNRLEESEQNEKIPIIINFTDSIKKPTIEPSNDALSSFGVNYNAEEFVAKMFQLFKNYNINDPKDGKEIRVCYIIEINSLGKNKFLDHFSI